MILRSRRGRLRTRRLHAAGNRMRACHYDQQLEIWARIGAPIVRPLRQLCLILKRRRSRP